MQDVPQIIQVIEQQKALQQQQQQQQQSVSNIASVAGAGAAGASGADGTATCPSNGGGATCPSTGGGGVGDGLDHTATADDDDATPCARKGSNAAAKCTVEHPVCACVHLHICMCVCVCCCVCGCGCCSNTLAHAHAHAQGAGAVAATPYNLYMKEELVRIKKADPSLVHKEAFKQAAANWGASARRALPLPGSCDTAGSRAKVTNHTPACRDPGNIDLSLKRHAFLIGNGGYLNLDDRE